MIESTSPEHPFSYLQLIADAMGALRDQTNEKDWTMAQILVLATVGIKGEVPQSELVPVSQLSESATSRVIYKQIGQDAKQYMRLLRVREDPDNRRKKLVSLTKDGKQALAAVSAKLRGASK